MVGVGAVFSSVGVRPIAAGRPQFKSRVGWPYTACHSPICLPFPVTLSTIISNKGIKSQKNILQKHGRCETYTFYLFPTLWMIFLVAIMSHHVALDNTLE